MRKIGSDELRHIAEVRDAPGTVGRPPEARLSHLERRAVDVARRDPLSSIRAPSRFDRLLVAAFALRRPLPLADAKLEAVRRYAVAARLGGRYHVDRERAALLAHGYSEPQAAMVERLALAA